MKLPLKNNLKFAFAFVFTILFGLNDFIFAQNNQEDIFSPYRKGDKWGISTLDKKIVVPPIYDEPLRMYRDSSIIDGKILYYASVKINEKYGAVNEKGELFIPAIHSNPVRLCQGFFISAEKDGEMVIKQTIYTYNQKKIFSGEFISELITRFKDGLLAVPLGNAKLGFINYKGKTVIPFIYNEGLYDYNFKNGFALVRKFEERKMGVINKKNKVIYPFVLDEYTYMTVENGIITLRIINDDAEIRLDTKGKILPKKEMKDVEIPNSSNFIKCILENKKYAYIIVDKNKKPISENHYVGIPTFKNGIAVVTKLDSLGYRYSYLIDENDNLVLPPAHYYTNALNENLYIIQDKKGKQGIFDIKAKKIIIPCKYSYCWENISKDGLMLVLKTENNKNRYIIINQKGEEVKEITDYDFVDSFLPFSGWNINDYIQVRKNDKKAILDSDFKEVIPFSNYISPFVIRGKCEVLIERNGLYGVVNMKNETLIPFEYESIENDDSKNLLKVKKNGKTFYIKAPKNPNEKVIEYVE